MPSALDFHAILRALADHGVHHVVVEGVAAALQGAPLNTLDLDVVHDRSAENVERLLAALTELDARSRLHAGAIVRPDGSHLVGPGHVLLVTRAGPLDVLGQVGASRTYEDLHPMAERMDLGDGLEVDVLSLRAQIQVKEESGRPKDLAVLPLLRATLQERQRRGE